MAGFPAAISTLCNLMSIFLFAITVRVAGVVILACFLLPEFEFHVVHRNDDQLKMASLICRHGDRNIYKIVPTDPWKDEKYWPEGYYQLTELGKQKHYKLGQYLRERYAELVGDDESAAKGIYVQSTDKPRVIESAQANLAGFFSSDNHFNLTSIPIHVTPLEEDYVLAAEKRCDHFDYLMIEYEHTAAYTGIFDENKSLIKYLENKTALQLRTLTDMNNLYDTFFVERLKHFRLPPWTEKVMTSNDDFLNLALQWYVVFTPTADMKKLRSGFLLRNILNDFTKEAQSIPSSNHKLFMYFAHDITISNMLNSLGVFKLHMPPYASCIFFELHENDDIPYVQVFYKNTTNTNVPPIEIPNCGIKCPLNKFYQLYDHILPKSNVDEECTLREGEHLPPGGNPETNSL